MTSIALEKHEKAWRCVYRERVALLLTSNGATCAFARLLLRSYQVSVASYPHGRGLLTLESSGPFGVLGSLYFS